MTPPPPWSKKQIGCFQHLTMDLISQKRNIFTCKFYESVSMCVLAQFTIIRTYTDYSSQLLFLLLGPQICYCNDLTPCFYPFPSWILSWFPRFSFVQSVLGIHIISPDLFPLARTLSQLYFCLSAQKKLFKLQFELNLNVHLLIENFFQWG